MINHHPYSPTSIIESKAGFFRDSCDFTDGTSSRTPTGDHQSLHTLATTWSMERSYGNPMELWGVAASWQDCRNKTWRRFWIPSGEPTYSRQFIATSAEVTPKGSLVGESYSNKLTRRYRTWGKGK